MSCLFQYSFIHYLKALEFIHNLNIAHRVSNPLFSSQCKIFKQPCDILQDAFHDNFVVQWHPESLRTMKISISRPRVYLIDFETAVQFSAGCPSIERVSVGYPVTENYSRPCAPELASGKAYNPFKLDVWQLGNSFSGFKVRQCIFFTVILFAYRLSVSQSTIPKVDEVLAAMTDIDPVHRLDAKEAKDRLGTIINYMAPASLLIKPDNAEHGLP